MITFLGDVFLNEEFKLKFEIQEPFIFNLEYPITKNEIGYPNKVNLKCNENYIKQTFKINPIAVCLSNNHILDYNELGFLDTIKILKEENILYFGAGYEKDNVNNPLIIEIDNKKIAIFGFTTQSPHPVFAKDNIPGVFDINVTQIAEEIKKIKETKQAEKIIISIHWGLDDVYLPIPKDIETARNLIDAGADLIIGHHSHCIQPFEIY